MESDDASARSGLRLRLLASAVTLASLAAFAPRALQALLARLGGPLLARLERVALGDTPHLLLVRTLLLLPAAALALALALAHAAHLLPAATTLDLPAVSHAGSLFALDPRDTGGLHAGSLLEKGGLA